jgi:hypothetical protein
MSYALSIQAQSSVALLGGVVACLDLSFDLLDPFPVARPTSGLQPGEVIAQWVIGHTFNSKTKPTDREQKKNTTCLRVTCWPDL